MIIDGVFASQAIDSSGEILDIDGCDISTLARDGVLNYEHKEGDKKTAEGGNNGEEIVGRILYAKKIFSISDCDTDREEKYWEQVKVPFIYGMCRLYDGAGHSGAQALAAQIRDHHANGEPLLVRYSIEGSTLDRDKDQPNRLTVSVARRVAATLKPCNRTAISGLVSDPKAPEGFDKTPETDRHVTRLIGAPVEKTETLEHPLYTKLGGVHEMQANPLIDEDSLAKIKLIAKASMLKALTAGSYAGVAPSALTGGSALQREDRGLKARAMAAVRDYGKKKFDKAEFRAFAKTYLPEADDHFLDHFTDLAHDYHMKKAELSKAMDLDDDAAVQPQEGLKWAEPPKAKAPPKPKKPKKGEAPAPAPVEAPHTPLIQPGDSMRSTPNPHAPIPGVGGGAKNRLALTPEGSLITPGGDKLHLHIPTGPEYLSILRPNMHDMSETQRNLYIRTVHEPWERAMSSWMELNKAAREGRLPRSVVKMAGLFSAMSPNTGVPLQERHFGHIMDMLHEGAMDISKPVTEEQIEEFKRRAQGPSLPMWNRDLYESTIPPEHLPEDERARYPQGRPAFPPPGVDTEEEAAERAAKPNKFGNEKAELPQIAGLRSLDDIMPHLEHMFATHRDNGRAMANELMQMKAAYKRQATKLGAAGAKEAMAGSHPIVQGFGPKLARYLLTMAGAGNMFVPDRHMTRSLFNLGKDDPLSHYLATQVVTKAQNEPILQALDQHFFHKHPAVQHVLQKYPEHFKGHEEQAIFPAFWLHWLHIPHYERNQGRETEATIGGTDHRVFWDSLQDAMRRHGIPIHGQHFEYSPPEADTSFDFGHNLLKAQAAHPMAHLPIEVRALGAMVEMKMKHGGTGALQAYFAHILPALMDAERKQRRIDPDALVRKMEVLSINLKQATAEARELRKAEDERARGDYSYQDQPVDFAGHQVIPGSLFTSKGKYALLHEDENHFIGVPHEHAREWRPEHLVKFPKAKQNTHYWVVARPAVPVSELE